MNWESFWLGVIATLVVGSIVLVGVIHWYRSQFSAFGG